MSDELKMRLMFSALNSAVSAMMGFWFVGHLFDGPMWAQFAVFMLYLQGMETRDRLRRIK